MDKYRLGVILVVVGVMIPIVIRVALGFPDTWSVVTYIMQGLGAGLNVSGCYLVIRHKDRSWVWALSGLLWVVGPIVVFGIDEKSEKEWKEGIEERERRKKRRSLGRGVRNLREVGSNTFGGRE